MKQAIPVLQIILGVILGTLILLQAKGTGLGSLGGGMGFYGTRRGAEKSIFVLTIIVAALFLITSLVGAVI